MARTSNWRDRLRDRLGEGAFERLEEHDPELAAILEEAMGQDATPEEVYRFCLQHDSSPELARWARAACQHLVSHRE